MPKTKDKPPDPRHIVFRDLIFSCYQFLNDNEKPPWDGSEASALAKVLAAKPDLTEQTFKRWLWNYARSEDITPGARPRKFLPNIFNYAAGPLNTYGRKLNGTSKGTQQFERINEARQRAIENIRTRNG